MAAQSVRPGVATRIEQLTGLRFVAAIGVVLCHYAGVLALPEWTRFLTDFLGSGVALFFVLSGFVLAHTYDGAHGLGRSSWSLRDFYVARAARVLPVYWLSLLGILVLYVAFGFDLSLGGPPPEKPAISFALNFLALQAWWPDLGLQQFWNAPGWSISSEAFFYLLFPWLLQLRWLNGSARVAWTLWATMAVGLGILAIIVTVSTMAASDADVMRGRLWLAYAVRCPLFGLFCFVMGINLARSHRSGRSTAPSARVMALLTLALLSVAWLVSWQKPLHPLGFYVEICAIYLVFTPYYVALIRYLVEGGNLVSRQLANRVSIRLGDASYALYLLHWPLLCLLVHGPVGWRDRAGLAWVTVAVLIAVSWITYRYFEDPLRRGIRRWMQASS